MKIDRIAGMIETPEEEIIEEETIEVTIKEVTSEEVETFAATCRQLQSELYATIQHNEILESKMISLQERVVALEMKMNNNILDERDSQLASDDFWEGCDGHSNLRWDLGTEEDEW
ncbi:hypothetical protein N7486_001930 [Penicillium sp. IBT 16267x]|nr:hypothetical protein N7486_001930 [Penicillium sp. IBT 16267x]